LTAKRKILIRRSGNIGEVLFVEDELEDGSLSCSDISLRDFYIVHPGGLVTKDNDRGDVVGVVADWNTKEDA
jgi:hypothetical protein